MIENQKVDPDIVAIPLSYEQVEGVVRELPSGAAVCIPIKGRRDWGKLDTIIDTTPNNLEGTWGIRKERGSGNYVTIYHNCNPAPVIK